MKPQKLVPLYHQIYLTLRKELLTGMYAADDISNPMSLPGELELSELYSVSRVTIRRALAALEDDGLIVRRHGAGTFAVPQPQTLPVQHNLDALYQDLTAAAQGYSVDILDRSLVDTPSFVLAEFPTIGPRCFHLSLLSHSRGGPAHLNHQYVPVRFADLLDPKEFGKVPLLLQLKQRGVLSDVTELSFSASAADIYTAEKLAVPVGSPLIATRRTSVDARGEPIEYFDALTRPDLYGYRVRYQH